MNSFNVSEAYINGIGRGLGSRWTRSDHLSLNRLKSKMSGPVDGQTLGLPRHTAKASDNRTSNMCCRQAIHSRLRPIAVSRRVQAPSTLPVFEAVVSKHIPITNLSHCHDFKRSRTATV